MNLVAAAQLGVDEMFGSRAPIYFSSAIMFGGRAFKIDRRFESPDEKLFAFAIAAIAGLGAVAVGVAAKEFAGALCRVILEIPGNPFLSENDHIIVQLATHTAGFAGVLLVTKLAPGAVIDALGRLAKFQAAIARK
jgi:hypothetical protein